MSITRSIENIFKKVLPSPFAIAVLLTLITIFLAFFFTSPVGENNHLLTILSYWEKGTMP